MLDAIVDTEKWFFGPIKDFSCRGSSWPLTNSRIPQTADHVKTALRFRDGHMKLVREIAFVFEVIGFVRNAYSAHVVM
jgi:hypothetical protein